jgi:hypothetical protein
LCQFASPRQYRGLGRSNADTALVRLDDDTSEHVLPTGTSCFRAKQRLPPSATAAPSEASCAPRRRQRLPGEAPSASGQRIRLRAKQLLLAESVGAFVAKRPALPTSTSRTVDVGHGIAGAIGWRRRAACSTTGTHSSDDKTRRFGVPYASFKPQTEATAGAGDRR